MTDNEKKVLARVVSATRFGPDLWTRATGSGERVTLAALHRKGILARRPRRRVSATAGVPFATEGADVAYEYRPSSLTASVLGEARDERRGEQVDLDRLYERTCSLMREVLPRETDGYVESSLPAEIAARVVENAKVVGSRGLLDQVLVVLADYRTHAWAGKALAEEGVRVRLARKIVGEAVAS